MTIFEDLPYLALPDDKKIGYEGLSFDKPPEEEAEVKKPSLKETAAASVRQFNDVWRGVTWLAESYNPYRDNTIQEGYDPVEKAMKVRPEDRAKIYQTTSDLEGDYLVKKIQQEYTDQDITARSGWFSNLITIGGASVISPTSWIPLAATVKYGQVTKGAFMGAVNAAKYAVPASIIQNAITTGTKETEGVKEWVQNSILESFIGMSIGGSVGAYAAQGVKSNVNTAKAVFKAIDDEVGIALNVDAKGVPTGKMTAYPLEGAGVGADAVRIKKVQELLDKTNPLENNPLTKKLFSWAHPIIRGITSPWDTIKDFTDAMFPHNLQVAGGDIAAIRGASAHSLQNLWSAQLESMKLLQNEAWLQSNGLESGIARNIRGAIGERRGNFIPELKFSEDIAKSYRRGAKTGNPHVDQMARLYKDEIFDKLWNEVVKRNPGLKKHEFTNITEQLSRIYNKAIIQEYPEKFLEDLVSYSTGINDQIQQLMAPIERTQALNRDLSFGIDELKDLIAKSTSKEEQKSLKKQLKDSVQSRKENNKTIRAIESEIQRRIDEGQISLDMLDTAPQLTKAQLDQIELLQKPISDLEKKIKEVRRGLKSADKPKRIESRKEVRRLKDELNGVKSKLESNIESEGFDQALVREVKDKYGKVKKVLRDASNKPKLRRVLTPEEINKSSKGSMDKILQMNEEQVAGQIFDSAFGQGGSDFLKQRTLLWNDAQAEKWLVNDMNVISSVYVDQMVKRIQLADVLGKYGLEVGETLSGKEGIAKILKKEFDEKQLAIMKKGGPDSAKQQKQLRKEFDEGVDFLNKSMKVYMGNYADKSSTTYRVTNGMKQFAAATLLGNLPILALTEFFTPLFKFAFDEYIFDGLKNMLGKYQKVLKSGEVTREAFQDLGIGLNVALGSHMQALSGYGTQYLPKTVLERYVNNLTKLSHNISMANYMTDFQEVMVSFMSQAKTIRYLEKLERGEELNSKEIGRLDELRFNPLKEFQLSDGRILNQRQIVLEQVRKHGTPMEGGGWVSNWHLWDDYAFDAREAFKAGIVKEARSVITKPNALDVPFFFRDPLMSLSVQFLSWPFAATMNFALPLMTKPDGQKFIGLLMTMAAGSMINPLRQLSKGEDVDLSFKALSSSAFVNSGFFTWYMDAFQKGNAALDLPFMRPFQGDRFRKKEPWSLLGGPTAGIAADVATMFSAAANGDITQRDMRNAWRYTLPWSYNWLTKQPIDAMIESWGFPEKREPRG